MSEGLDLPMPKVDVAFATTKVFRDHFPEEAAAQDERFNAPTWQQRITETTPLVPAPRQQPDPILADETPVDPQLEDYSKMFAGAIFFALLAYFAFRGVQWHLQ